MEITPRMSDHALLARTAAAGSMVLLKNTGGTLPLLPLEDGTPMPVAVFGAGQIRTCLCSADIHPWKKGNILDALCASRRIVPDGLLAHRYRNAALKDPLDGELDAAALDLSRLREENAAAIVVIARSDRDTRTLTEHELALLRRVCAVFERTVLVLNTPLGIDLGEAVQCPAIVYAGLGGQEMGAALCDLLTGKIVPTGRLARAWGDFPFGWGLGYGAPEIVGYSAALDGCRVILTAQIENHSEVQPAQELVQVWCDLPAQGGHSVRRLMGWQKTRLLAPGEGQVVTVEFSIADCAVRRAESAGYVLGAGYYDFYIGTNAASACAAGSVLVPHSAIVQACAPGGQIDDASDPAAPALTAEEQEALAAVRGRAMRLQNRNLPRVARRRGDRFTGCRGDGQAHDLAELRRGECSVFSLIAALDDLELRRLCGALEAPEGGVKGALWQTPGLPEYGIAAAAVCGGGTSLSLEAEILDEEGHVARRQNCTAFPAAALLACSFDPALVRAVGAAVGREAREYGAVWCIAPRIADWSPVPAVGAALAAAFGEGVWTNAAPVLPELPQDAQRGAAGAYRALLLPDGVTEDSPAVRAKIIDWRYPGAFLTEGERLSAEASRTEYERAALRLVRVLKEYL